MSPGSFVREKVLDPLRRAQGTPESIARGGALGVWVALTPTVGAQSLVVGVLAVPLRANLPIALLMCWITNPLTLVPFYYAFYWVGAVMLNMPLQGYASLGRRIADQFLLVGQDGVIDAMLPLGREIILPMVVGSVVLATVVALPTYHVLLRLFRRRLQAREGGGSSGVQGGEPT